MGSVKEQLKELQLTKKNGNKFDNPNFTSGKIFAFLV